VAGILLNILSFSSLLTQFHPFAMRYIFILLLLTSMVAPTVAQRISRIDFDSVRAATTSAQSPYAYASLLRRFQAADTTLTPLDFKYIYYGQVYTAQYQPYGSEESTGFRTLYQQQKWQDAIRTGEKVLAKNPLNLHLIFQLLVCYYSLGDKGQAKHYAQQYFPIIKAIRASGDGKSIATAYVVAVVHDEYEILKALNLDSNRQALVGHTDVLTATPVDDQGKPTGGPEQEVYFDITKPFSSLGAMLKSK
jgi:tetratricopeptide (TPR) repeat protein